jgi:hypothetical protein
MPKTKISEFDVDPANNTDINSINIAEGCAPSGINNAIRQLMSDLKEFQTGAGGDPFNGAVNGTLGATTPNTAVVTTLTANTSVSTDTISEKTSAAGVTIDSVLLKDNTVTANSVNSQNTFGFKNRIINGAMVIDQRGGTITVNTAVTTYGIDRWAGAGRASAGVYTFRQTTNAPVGFTNALFVDVTTADASLAVDDLYAIQQRIEGYNIADLGWGTANAKTVTLSFWVRSNLTGTFGGSITNSAFNRSYPFSYTISSADTWEQKTITIAGDTTGTWLTDNGVGMRVYWGLGIGSNYNGTVNTWAGAGYISVTGANNVMSSTGNDFYITGVQLEKGSTATSFDYRPYGTELALCQRYYQKAKARQFWGVYETTSIIQSSTIFLVEMRATPTVTRLSNSGWGQSGGEATNTTGFLFTGASTRGCIIALTTSGTSPSIGIPATCATNDFIDFNSEL